MSKQHIVIQRSSFLQTRDNDSLTEKELDIVLAMISMVHSNDEDEKIYEKSAQEWYALLGIQGSDRDLQLKSMIQNFMMKIVEIPCEDGGWLMTHWLSSVNYFRDSETVQIKLTPELRPYFLHIKNSLILE